MTTQYPPKKAAALAFELAVFGSDGKFLSGATFASSTVSKDGGSFSAMTNAPAEIGSTGIYTISLTGSEMNADRVALKFVVTDAADIAVNLQTAARQIDDLAYPTTSGRSIDVTTTGEVGLDFDNVKDASAPHTLANLTVPTVTNLTNAPADSSGVTTLLARLTATRAGYLDLLNSYLDSAVSAVKTVVDAIQAKTDNLPSDPADESLIEAAISAAQSAVLVSTGAIKAKTDNLPASPAAVGSQMDLVNAPNATAVTAIQSGLATAANQTTALNRLGSITGSGANTLLGYIRALASKTTALPSDLTSGGLAYDNTTDSLEAIRDRGDAAWTGGSPPTVDAIADEIETRTIAGVTTVGSVTGAVGSVTGAVGSVTGNVGGNVVGTVPDSAGVTTLLSRLSAARAGYLDALAGWAGTLLGAVRALARKDATSADLGGTYNPATDSHEAAREKLDTLVSGAPTTESVTIEESEA